MRLIHIRSFYNDKVLCGAPIEMCSTISYSHAIEQPQHVETLNVCKICLQKLEEK